MTEEEFYILLLKHNSEHTRFSDFNPEFLKNYEIAKLFLEKFGIHQLGEEQQLGLNLEAVLNWDIPSVKSLIYFSPKFLKKYEISNLVLKKFGIHQLEENQQKNLNFEAVSNWLKTSETIWLKRVIPEILELLPEKINRTLVLQNSSIEVLPNLKSVEGCLCIRYSHIRSLPELEHIGEHLFIDPFQEGEYLPKLKSVGNAIYTSIHQIDYWRNYFNETGRTGLAEKVRIV